MVSETAKSYENIMADEDLKWSQATNNLLDKIDALKKALEPLARLVIPGKPTGNAGMYSINHDDIRRAKELLK